MKAKSYLRVGLVTVVTVTLFLAGCAAPAPPTPVPTKAPAAQPTKPPAVEAPKPVEKAAEKPADKPVAKAPAKTAMPAPLSPIVKVKVGDVASTSDGPIYVAMGKGFFKELGIEVELVTFDTAARMIPGLAAGQMDIGGGAISAGLYNAYVRGVPIKIVADRGRNITGHEFASLAIRTDLVEKVKDYKDLKGLKIAVSGKGAGGHAQLGKALAKGNLTSKDIDLIEMSWPNMVASFANKALDGGLLIEPFVTQVAERGVAVNWKRVHPDFYPNHQVGVLMYAPQFVQSQPEVARRFMIGHIRGIRAYMDAFSKGTGKDDIIKILTQYTSMKDPAAFQKVKISGFDRNGYLLVQHLIDDQDYYVSEGLIKPNEKADVNKMIDYSYVEYALGILGKE